MNADQDGTFAGGFEEVVSDLRREFLDELAEHTRGLQLKAEEVRRGCCPIEDIARDARRIAVSIQGNASNLGFPMIETVAQRMENFLADVKSFPPRALEDIVKYAEILTDFVEGREVDEDETPHFVRSLPIKLGFDENEIETRDVEIMLVMLHGTATRFVERELRQCGYRTNAVASTFEAIPQIIRTKPDLVVVSAFMPDLSGIDLAIALASMPATRNIPVAVITSLDPEDEYLGLLPAHVPVILKGPSFGDDLADALDRLFII